MPRLARNVFAGVPHHITQRGNRREDVFFTDSDRRKYLDWLGEYCEKWMVDILSYCLMTNHVHLVLKPTTADGLQRVLKPLHMRYAQRINRAKGWKGHLWQGRFFSSALDQAYTCSAIRYVERNPVSANMVERAEDYQWSSAAARCGLENTNLLVPIDELGINIQQHEWSNWLSGSDNVVVTSVISKHVEKGLPCGDDVFIAGLEDKVGRSLRFKPQGRPKKG